MSHSRNTHAEAAIKCYLMPAKTPLTFSWETIACQRSCTGSLSSTCSLCKKYSWGQLHTRPAGERTLEDQLLHVSSTYYEETQMARIRKGACFWERWLGSRLQSELMSFWKQRYILWLMTWQLVQWVKMCCFPSANKVTVDLMTRSGQNDRGRCLSGFVFSRDALVVGTDGDTKTRTDICTLNDEWKQQHRLWPSLAGVCVKRAPVFGHKGLGVCVCVCYSNWSVDVTWSRWGGAALHGHTESVSSFRKTQCNVGHIAMLYPSHNN